ncbi:MAG: hypothetical protein PPP56_13660 [Longimonas sp.]|uniref:hypothetical protein n=1 Tax=Longimonas sp. TaxID=2039626 RepID=UPI0033559169
MNNSHFSILFIFLMAIIHVSCSGVAFAQEFDPEEVEQQLMGTWVAEADPKSRWVFTEDTLQDYYDGELQAEDPFSVVHECRGEEVKEHDAGMLLVESQSGADICAVIQGLSEERLTLLSIPSGRLILFVREDHMGH